MRTDELVTFNIKGRCDFDQDFVQVCLLFFFRKFLHHSSSVMFLDNGLRFNDFVRQRNPKGAAEFDWNIWKFQKEQDLRLRVGYDMFDKVPKSE